MGWGVLIVRAQDYRLELSANVGYTTSEGFGVQEGTVLQGILDAFNPKSGFTWGAQLDVLPTPNFALGFLWSQQYSKLNGDIQNSDEDADFTDMLVHNYMGVFTYNFGDAESPFRPFIFGGLGATYYDPDAINGLHIDSATKFASTWGGGVKFFATPRLGLKTGIRWTPTYIKSDPEGIWCSPFWVGACWVVGDSDYSNQLEFNGGVVFRF
jgi:opacity protein-like surface antigen